MPERIYSEGLVLPDGRKVRVLAYDNGSIRFRISDTPYVLEEAFLSGGGQNHAIIKLAPRNPLTVPAEENGGDPLIRLRNTVVDLRHHLDNLPEPEGEGRIVKQHQREGMDAVITVLMSFIKEMEDTVYTDEDA